MKVDGTEEKRMLAAISHELKSPVDAISSYGRLIAADSSDPAIREYAKKIEAAASGMTEIIDSLLDNAAEYGEDYEREYSSAARVHAARSAEESYDSTPLVLVVDDDELIRVTAESILGKIFRIVTAESGEAALAELHRCEPSLILMDINMPGMDGFETLSRIRRSSELPAIPVIFLTGDEDRDIEIRCLKAGAADFVRKPLVSQVLTERVRRIIELYRLQNFLSTEVAVQTRRSAHLSKEIMLALSKAVDVKDHYTNGHSQRVASYSAEIARRMGKSKREQEDIYSMGLLHDVGKIGVSEAIINKTSRLDDNEYAQIKTHTTIGYDILKLITEIPGLATGARWHHERYDGRGYPDGLAGTDIPEEARIICVADCYDAMTSNRSYSTIREQAAVRDEILRCSGTQFDPEIAAIMIAMIDDDPEYRMSERARHGSSAPMIPHDIAAAQFVDDAPRPAETKPAGNAPHKPRESEAAKKGMQEKTYVPEVGGLDPAAARKNISDEEILAVTLKRFCDLMPSKLKKLEEAFAAADSGGDIAPYRIEVHSMKSSSATVGFTALSDIARALEMMAKDGDINGIRGLNGPFTEEWKQTYERLSEAYSAHERGSGGKEDGTEMLAELLRLLRTHMENMDIDAADGVMKIIGDYSYSADVQSMLKELNTSVLALDEDSVNRIADSILRETGK